MGLLKKVGKAFKKVGSAIGKVGSFALSPLKLAGGAAGLLQSVLGKLSSTAMKFLEKTPIGKLANKVLPKLLKTVQDLLNPAKLLASFGGAKNPADFAALLKPLGVKFPRIID